MKYTFILISFLVLGFSGNAQTGPAGVGNSSTLEVWLRSSDITVGDGNEIFNWPDTSGNNNDFVAIASGGIGPVWDSIAINGFPGVLFGGDADRFEDADGENYINGLSEFTLITLIQSDELSTVDVGIFDSEDPDGADDIVTWRYDDAGFFGGGSDVIKFGVEPDGNRQQLESADNTHTVSPQLLIGTWASGDSARLYLNGIQNAPSFHDPVQTGSIINATKAVIGRGPKDNGGSGWDGYIVEFALYNKALNDAERLLVENYLASKYKLPIATDFYAFENSHGIDVAGVGSTGSSVTTSAISADILGLNISQVNLDSGDFVMFGHDGGAIDSWLAAEQPLADTNFLRLEREWIFDTTGTPGLATLSIDTASLPSKTADYEFYYLWLDADGDFSSGATPYALTLVDSVYQVENLSIADGMYASISIHRSVINFDPVAFNGFETDGATSADFQVSIPYALYRDVSIDYELSGSSTYNDNNPAITTPATVTILAGNTSETISIAMNGDTDDESDETIVLDLDGMTGILAVAGADSIATYTINDEDGGDPTIQFDAPFSYAKKKSITIDQSMVSGSSDLEDFPILIRVDGADFDDIDSVQTQNNGFDIRFTYENSLLWLEHQIETYDQVNNEYLAWVKLPVLSASEDTKLDMYYGNTAATTDPSTVSVFDSSIYELVYHLEDATESTANANNGTLNGNAAIAAGLLGNGLELDGTDDYLIGSNDPSIEFNPTDKLSFSLWFRGTDNTAELISRMDPGQSNRGYSFRILNSGGARLGFLMGQSFGGTPVALRATTSNSATVVDGDWHYLVGTYDGSTDLNGVKIYVDGVNTSITSEGGLFNDNLAPGDNTNPNIPFSLGVRDGGGSTSNDTDGTLDEARVMRTELPADWIVTEYNNQNPSSTFISYAAGEVISGFNITESTDTIAFTVALSAINAAPTTVAYEIVDVTTSGGNDYAVAAGTVTIPADELSTTFTIDLNNDGIDEADETFTVNLFDPSSNANLGQNNSIDVTILDDDEGPVLTLADTIIAVNEGTQITSFTINLSAASGSNVSVDYEVTGNTAQSGADYSFPSGTLTIAPGNTSGAISFNIIDDEEIEVLETFSIKLSNAVNATIDASFDSLVVTINDNDNLGIDGPGGVGDADGTGTLVMWSIADSVQTTGNDVTVWPNEVGISELDLTPFGTAPTRVDNARNGHDEISFAAGVNDGIRTDFLSASYFPYNEATTFVITRHENRTLRSSTYATATSISGDIGSPRFSTHLPWSNNLYYDIGNCCNADGRVGPIFYELEWEGEYGIFAFRTGEDVGKEVWRNNTSLATVAGTDEFTNHNDYQFYLGHADVDPFAGDILEFVMYTNPLNDAQINIVNNYLAAKYDLAIENDLFAFNTTHSFDVAGIGFEDVNNFHNAAKADLLTISNASNLGAGDYVLLGHDNGLKSSWVTSDIPSDIPNLERIEREWRVDTTGTPGTISLALDTTKLPSKSAGYTEYIVLTDSDGDFTSGATIYPTTKVDGEYLANDIVVAQGTYITFGTVIRSIEFIGSATQDFEFNNNLLTLSLSLESKEDVTVNYNISGSATQGADFTLMNSGSITIPAGNLSTTIDLGIIDESVEESDETIVVEISNPPAGYQIGTNAIFTYTINDDDLDRTVNFDFFKYSRQVTIPAGNVSTDLTDFPLYFEYTDVSMRQLGDSDGVIENPLGYDISFYDSTSGEFLDHQLEYYDASTGQIAAWVKIPTLSSLDDTEITFLYGNAGIEFDQSSDSVWRSDFAGVWHMSGGDYTDASVNANNGTNQGASTVTGKLGQAGSFDGLSNVEVANDQSIQFNEDSTFTISLWYNGADISTSLLGMKDANSNDHGYSIFISNTDRALGRLDNPSGGEDRIRAQTSAINNGTWNNIVFTYDGSGAGRTGSIYVNGVEDNTLLQTDAGGLSDGDDLSPNVPFTIGSISNSAAISGAVSGLIDEVRLMDVVMSTDEIAISYANQNDPISFYTVQALQDTTSLDIDEDAGIVSVRVRVEPIDATQATTVDFGDSGSGIATVGADFNISSGTLSIPSGKRTANFSFNVVNDLVDEPNETVILSLSNPGANAKLGTQTTKTLTIIDDDDLPTIAFVDTISTANEGSSLVRIPVQLNVSSGNTASVDYEVKSSTATVGVDFTVLSGTLEIAAGELSNTISFQPIDDPDIEPVETVEIRLFNPQNAILSNGSDTLHLVRLKDNDDLGFEGPGGVGDVLNASGEKLLKVWLIADEATTNGGGQVTAWNNKIQNVSVDYTMIPASGNPNLVTNAINGRSVVSFEDTQDALVSTGALSVASFPGNELSIFIVTETDNLSQVSYAYATDDEEANTVENNSISASIPNNGNVEFSLAGDTESAPYLGAWIGNASIFSHVVSADTFLVRRNNNTIANDNSAGNNFTNHTNFNFYLGKSSSGSDHFQGDIAEVIMFSRELNLAQINIVNNYLAARYNLSIETDLYNFNVTHGNEVAGIGRENIDNQHVAARAGILTLSNASDLGDGDYVLFGHDDSDVTSWSSNEIPVDGILRTEREWRVDTTGTPGTVTIAIDTTLLPSKPVGNEDYIIIVDADGDFTSGASIVSTTLVDNEYKASDIALNSGDYFSIGIATRTVSFELVADNGFENTAKNVQVNLSLESPDRIDLDYVIKDGTATGGIVDYSLASTGTVSFLAGQTVTNIPLGIINDAELESDETIVLALRNPPSGVNIGADSVHTYTINDDDNFRKVQFAIDSISNAESIDSVYLVVEVDPVDPSNETTVLLNITGGTAESSPAPDYTFATDTIKIQPNETRDSLLVVIIDDVLFESTETIEFSLSGPTNSGLGDTTTLIYQIADNDTQVEATFQNTNVTVDEGASIASIVVELDNLSGQDIVVDFAVDAVKSTATSGGTDYSLNDGSITIPAGSAFATINVPLTDDDVEESNERIVIGISGPNVVLDQADTVIITIADNDALAGFYGPGGVGNRENNLLWLDAYNVNGRGVANPTDLDAVPTWKDNSGNGYVFTATSMTEAQQPTWDSDVLNGAYPSITISNSQLGFEAPDGFSNSLSNYTMLTVARQFSGNYMVESNTAGNGEFALNLSTGGLYTFNGAVQTTGNLSTVANLTTWQFDALATNTAEIFRNGTSVFTNSGFNSMSISNNLSIGNRYDGVAQGATDFRGRVSEVIIYNNPINLAQQVIVENYLAAKYGLTIANDLYDYQGIFFYDVVGVGSTASEGQHLEAMSDSLLLISNPAALDSGEFVFIGHDNGEKATWTTFEAPRSGANVRRIAREWRVDVVGNPGDITFKVDVDQLPTPENGFTQYAIYVDTDGDFNSGANVFQLDFSPTSGLYVTNPISINVGDYVTIGVVKPVVEFAVTSSNGAESFTNPKIEVILNFSRDENVTVDFEATAGTATGANVDYLLSASTLTIAPGNTSAEIDLGVINDNRFEPSETVEITLANPSDNISLGTIVSHTYTINDDDSDRKAEFSTTDFTVAESDVDQLIEISLLSLDGLTPIISDGSDYIFIGVDNSSAATVAVDFDTTGVFISDTLYFQNGTSTTSFNLSLVDDAEFETNESIVFNITGGNINIGDANQLTITLTDNDALPTAQFSQTSAFGQESISPVQVDVELSAASGALTTINYTVSSTNATQGTDFDLTDGSIEFAPGDTETSILLVVNDDVIAEPGEVVSITLSTPVDANATLGANTQFDYTILDNDNLGGTGPGGVGDNTNNTVWLRGDNFDNATTWSDKSGNNVSGTAIGSPSLVAVNAGFNDKPTVEFDGMTDAFDLDMLTSDASDYDVFLVYETSVVTAQELLSTDGGLVLGHELGFGYSDDGGNQGSEFSGVSPSIYNYSLQSGANNAVMRVDGTDDNVSTYTQTDIATNTFIGSSVTSSNYFSGNLAEVVVYNSTLNSAQRKIVETYLGERYGIVNANDLYDNPGFTEDVAGIGRDASTSLHLEATSDGQLTVKDANSLSSIGTGDDGDFMLFGHNGETTSDWDPVTNPGILRLRKEWRFDVDGDPGAVTVEIDLAAFDTTATRTDFPTLSLLVSSSGDFDADIDRIYSLSLVAGTIYQATGVILNNDDVLTLGATRNISNGAGILEFNAPSSWVTGIVPGSGDDVFIAGTDSVYLTGNVTVGSVTIDDGGVLFLNGFKLELDQNCITLNGSGRVNTTPGEVEYSRSGDQCVTCLSYDDVTFSTSGRKFMLDSIVVTGNLIIEDNVVELDTDGFDIYLGGNWTNQGTFTADNGLVILNGMADQSIQSTGAGGESFYQLLVDKGAGKVLLESNVAIADSLDLTAGVINLQVNDLSFTNTEADHLKGSSTSYIQVDGAGELFFSISAGQTYNLPIGDDNDYSPSSFVINTVSGTVPRIGINLRDSKFPGISTEFSYLSRYWTFNDFNITAINYDWTFTYTDADVAGGVESALEPIKFSGARVDDILDFPDFTRNAAANQITWENLTSFSSGSAGVEEGGVPLPVELLFFEAIPNGKNGVEVNWATSTETNNHYFTIEKSSDAFEFVEVAQIDGAGTVNDERRYTYLDSRPYFGISYYRLKQTDFDGTVSYSDIVRVDRSRADLGRPEIIVYPNPAVLDEGVTLSVDRLIPGDIVSASIISLDGTVVYVKEFVVDQSGRLDHELKLSSDLAAGNYILSLKYQGRVDYQRVIFR